MEKETIEVTKAEIVTEKDFIEEAFGKETSLKEKIQEAEEKANEIEWMFMELGW